jgi:uncharacterized repeat protein (TIGR03803 family)
MSDRVSVLARRLRFLAGSAASLDRFALGFCVCLLFCGIGSADAGARVETVLHSFDDNGTDGYNPTSALSLVKGSLYGTANYGGAYGYGIAFSVNPKTRAETILHSFSGGTSDGSRPVGTLLGVDGMLYGATTEGGTADGGTIFELDPVTGAETVLWNFLGSYYGDGDTPLGYLIFANGTLYGTTIDGGQYGYGTVFSMNRNNESVLYSFEGGGNGGNGPNAGLAYIHSTLYGTTQLGGASNRGVVFSVDLKTGKEKVVHSFLNNGVDGIFPAATVINVNGQLFGTTTGGGAYSEGTVYSVDPSTRKETVLYSFQGDQDGSAPQDPVINVGQTLYGTTVVGGTSDDGTVFSLDLNSGKEKVLFSFNGSDGAYPYFAVMSRMNKFYSTTAKGGAYDNGTVFDLKP